MFTPSKNNRQIPKQMLHLHESKKRNRILEVLEEFTLALSNRHCIFSILIAVCSGRHPFYSIQKSEKKNSPGLCIPFFTSCMSFIATSSPFLSYLIHLFLLSFLFFFLVDLLVLFLQSTPIHLQ